MEKNSKKHNRRINVKILIIDDCLDKIREIMKTILEVDGIQEDMLEYSTETSDALSKTKDTEYDLLILDLNMPEKLIDGTNENAGALFIDELLGIYSYKKPIEIVVLSAYDEYESKFTNNSSRIGFKLLRYDESTLEWKKKIESNY